LIGVKGTRRTQRLRGERGEIKYFSVAVFAASAAVRRARRVPFTLGYQKTVQGNFTTAGLLP
jgi:hypothetical protein